MVGGYLGYVAYWRDPAHLPSGVLWVGNGTLRIAQLRSFGLDHGLSFRSESRLQFWANTGALGSRFEVSESGLTWKMKWLANLAGVSGSVMIPWSDIDGIESGRPAGIGGTNRGGRLAIHLKTGGTLDASFIGPKQSLIPQLSSHLR